MDTLVTLAAYDRGRETCPGYSAACPWFSARRDESRWLSDLEVDQKAIRLPEDDTEMLLSCW
jgi:hypothetical protein